MPRSAAIIASSLALLMAGCAGGTRVPTTAGLEPEPSALTPAPQPTLGVYRLAGDPAAGTVALSPILRDAQAIGDSFNVDLTTLTGKSFTLAAIEFINPTTLRVHFSWHHPLPDTSTRKDLAAFDLRMHVLSDQVLKSFAGADGYSAPLGTDGAPEAIKLADIPLGIVDGWSTFGQEVVEPAVGALAPNTYPFVLVHEDTGRAALNPDAPAGWNVVPQGLTEYPFAIDLGVTPGEQINLVLALDASWESSSKNTNQIPEPGPGSRLHPLFFNPNANLKEAWRASVQVTGSLIAGAPSTTAQVALTAYDHQGPLPASGNFDPFTAASTALRYSSALDSAVLSIPGVLSGALTVPGATFTGDGTPATPYRHTETLNGGQTAAVPGTYLGVAAFVDSMSSIAGSTAPLPTLGYTQTRQLVTRRDFATYMPFSITVAAGSNQQPVADLAATPTTVPFGGTVSLQPGPGCNDPDGAIVLYEYDFDYDGTIFTVDASRTTTAAVPSPAQTTAGARTMALRVTDDGTPVKVGIDTVAVTVEPAPNTGPTADLAIAPPSVAQGGTVQLSPGPGTGDPDGRITLWEYDFNYVGPVFDVDASRTTAAAVTSSSLGTPGTVTMAMRVTDNGTPGLTALDTATVTVVANQGPTADLQVAPNPVAQGLTVQLSPGPGTADPDGTITLWEYDFDYVGATFTVDASRTTSAAVTSLPLGTAGNITMAMRVTDNGSPGLTALDTVVVTVNPPAGATWTEINDLLVNGDPTVAGDETCISCHKDSEGGLLLKNNDKGGNYTRLVNAATNNCNGRTYVVPNNTGASFLYEKLLANPSCEKRMPEDGPYWSSATMALVASWINSGAPND